MEMKPLCVEKTEYLVRDEKIIAYTGVTAPCRPIGAKLGGKTLKMLSNLREPLDLRMHIFEADKAELAAAGGFTLSVQPIRGIGAGKVEFGDPVGLFVPYDASAIVPLDTAMTRADRHLIFRETEADGGADGTAWRVDRWETPAGEAVRVFTCRADHEKTRMIAGTPNGETEFVPRVLATVMEEAEAAERTGEKVLFAANADFFDIFGDGHPSGLCVRDGHVVANPDAVNPFFGVRKDGTPVIGYPRDFDLGGIAEAVSGGQIIVEDGRPADLAVLEPFGEVAHPRTAFGITAEGDLIVMIVDGRRPAWSNGAALCELAELMIREGAVTAMNADGGGSSTFIVRRENGLEMINHPADLFRPMEDLVRPLFDSFIIVAK